MRIKIINAYFRGIYNTSHTYMTPFGLDRRWKYLVMDVKGEVSRIQEKTLREFCIQRKHIRILAARTRPPGDMIMKIKDKNE